MRVVGALIAAAIVTACTMADSKEPSFPVEPDGGIGDGISRPMLETISPDQFKRPWRVFEAPVACIFMAQGNVDPLLVATSQQANGANGQAIIRINSRVIYLTDNAGVSGRIEKGGTFSSEAIEIHLERNGVETRHKTQNTFFWPAILKISQDEGGSNLYEGHYECDASKAGA
ncbi:hypothetical protein GCM10009096_27490 [Parasphingorhabdus litoris]|uniref:DUF3455 domain-containing protein n=1 Tax=Parasphingorhabdus litoris TaxID=394733 RepID=A0ABN1AU64_9SPHN|nr:hypothetical protein [Parasphingorhabdus litoris]